MKERENPLAPADMLERLRLVTEINLNDLTEIPYCNRESLKRRLITACFEDCADFGIGVEAGEFLRGYYTKNET